MHEGRISTLSLQKQELALAREPEDYSRKFRYNQRRELRLLEEQGGELLPFTELSSSEQAKIYSDLFEKRWGFATPGKERLADVLELLRPYLVGSYICVNGQPAAAQILYRVESPDWISVEYINGGVDPQFNELSPGSVLTWVNTQAEWEHARAQGKALRYSFGRADREYKDRWCQRRSLSEPDRANGAIKYRNAGARALLQDKYGHQIMGVSGSRFDRQAHYDLGSARG